MPRGTVFFGFLVVKNSLYTISETKTAKNAVVAIKIKLKSMKFEKLLQLKGRHEIERGLGRAPRRWRLGWGGGGGGGEEDWKGGRKGARTAGLTERKYQTKSCCRDQATAKPVRKAQSLSFPLQNERSRFYL